ncbi:MAG: acyltransferase family protein [Chitinophagaceae bacterium]
MRVNQRYLSLDIFRGVTVAFMILVNNPGTWSHIYDPLEHAAWHGLTPTDIVFPFFLFAVGNAMAFVLPRLRAGGNNVFWKKIITRTLLIFLIGTFLNWFPFSRWEDGRLVFRGWEWAGANGEIAGIRVAGTLQRIAICYFLASVIVYYAKVRMAAVIGGLILLLYWLLCIAMNPSDPYSFEGWFGKAIDLRVFGAAHVYHGDGVAFENEGIVSTFPAVVSVIIGFIVGDYIRRRGKEAADVKPDATNSHPIYKIISVLFTTAVTLLLTGYIWSLFFPLNKKIQSSSFILTTAGLATLLLSTLVYLAEAKNKKGGWTSFFAVFGKNALFIYALSELISDLFGFIRIPNGINESGKMSYISPLQWFYQNICAEVPGPPENGSLLYAVCIVLFLWTIGYGLDKKKIYIKV